MKLETNILFIKSCEREQIIPTFAKVSLSIKSGGHKLKGKTSKPILDTEVSDKQHQLRKLRKEMRSVAIELKLSLSFIEFDKVVHLLIV